MLTGGDALSSVPLSSTADSSAPVEGAVVRAPILFPVRRKAQIGSVFQPVNVLLLATAVAAAPFIPEDFSSVQVKKSLRSFDLPRNAVLLETAPPPVKQSLESGVYRKNVSGPFFPARGLDPGAPQAAPFEPYSFDSVTARKLYSPSATLSQALPLFAPVAPPFVGESLEPAPVKKSVWSYNQGTNTLLLPSVPTTPLIQQSEEFVPARKEISGPFFPARGLDPGAPIVEVKPFSTNLFETILRKREVYSEPPENLVIFSDLPPIASAQWLDSAPVRRVIYSQTSQSSQFIPVPVTEPPVIRSQLEFRPERPLSVPGPEFPARGLDPQPPPEGAAPFIPPSFDSVSRKKGSPFELFPNLAILSDLPPIASAQWLDSAPPRKKAVQSFDFPNLLHSTLDLPPIASAQWLDSAPKKAIRYPETSVGSPVVLLTTEVFKPFAEIVWPSPVVKEPLYNLAFDSFFSPDKIPEPPPPVERVEIDGGVPKKRKSAKEELEEIFQPTQEILVPAPEAKAVPSVLAPVAKVVLLKSPLPPINAISIDVLPEVEKKMDAIPEEDIPLLIMLGLL